MAEAAQVFFAVLGSLSSWVWLALSQERHWGVVAHTAATQRPQGRMHATSCAALQFASLWLLIGAQGAAFGGLLWGVVACASAVCVAFALAWRPAWLRPWAWAAGCRIGEGGR